MPPTARAYLLLPASVALRHPFEGSGVPMSVVRIGTDSLTPLHRHSGRFPAGSRKARSAAVGRHVETRLLTRLLEGSLSSESLLHTLHDLSSEQTSRLLRLLARVRRQMMRITAAVSRLPLSLPYAALQSRLLRLACSELRGAAGGVAFVKFASLSSRTLPQLQLSSGTTAADSALLWRVINSAAALRVARQRPAGRAAAPPAASMPAPPPPQPPPPLPSFASPSTAAAAAAAAVSASMASRRGDSMPATRTLSTASTARALARSSKRGAPARRLPDGDCEAEKLLPAGTQSVLAVPLLDDKQRVIGVLLLRNKHKAPAGFNAADELLLAHLASVLSVRLRRTVRDGSSQTDVDLATYRDMATAAGELRDASGDDTAPPQSVAATLARLAAMCSERVRAERLLLLAADHDRGLLMQPLDEAPAMDVAGVDFVEEAEAGRLAAVGKVEEDEGDDSGWGKEVKKKKKKKVVVRMRKRRRLPFWSRRTHVADFRHVTTPVLCVQMMVDADAAAAAAGREGRSADRCMVEEAMTAAAGQCIMSMSPTAAGYSVAQLQRICKLKVENAMAIALHDSDGKLTAVVLAVNKLRGAFLQHDADALLDLAPFVSAALARSMAFERQARQHDLVDERAALAARQTVLQRLQARSLLTRQLAGLPAEELWERAPALAAMHLLPAQALLLFRRWEEGMPRDARSSGDGAPPPAWVALSPDGSPVCLPASGGAAGGAAGGATGGAAGLVAAAAEQKETVVLSRASGRAAFHPEVDDRSMLPEVTMLMADSVCQPVVDAGSGRVIAVLQLVNPAEGQASQATVESMRWLAVVLAALAVRRLAVQEVADYNRWIVEQVQETKRSLARDMMVVRPVSLAEDGGVVASAGVFASSGGASSASSSALQLRSAALRRVDASALRFLREAKHLIRPHVYQVLQPTEEWGADEAGEPTLYIMWDCVEGPSGGVDLASVEAVYNKGEHRTSTGEAGYHMFTAVRNLVGSVIAVVHLNTTRRGFTPLHLSIMHTLNQLAVKKASQYDALLRRIHSVRERRKKLAALRLVCQRACDRGSLLDSCRGLLRFLRETRPLASYAILLVSPDRLKTHTLLSAPSAAERGWRPLDESGPAGIVIDTGVPMKLRTQHMDASMEDVLTGVILPMHSRQQAVIGALRLQTVQSPVAKSSDQLQLADIQLCQFYADLLGAVAEDAALVDAV
eukprot:PLAT7278.1.p1 GENE.PLAT7278.1~~PLAT7278.1.p1  ORF type:complete len:1198 (-),score=692.08 PLAT7278.1:113-3706(-)